MMDCQKGQIIFMCEACETVFDIGTSNFERARAKLLDAEWRTTTPDDGKTWEHWCGDCTP